MKRCVQCVCIILVAAMFLGVPVNAVENVEPRASLFFSRSSVYLTAISGTTFEAWFDVTATGTMDELGASAIKIQRSSDGVNWTTMKTYTKESYSHLIDEDTVLHGSYVSYTGSRGYYYRARVDLYAKNSSGTGSMTEYTSPIYFAIQ